MEIKSVQCLRNRLRRCRHLTVYRELLGYNHHVFVGNVNQSGCDIYHYKFALAPCLKLSFPAQVTKERLEYSSYSQNREIQKIFNFETGDRVVIVNRKDYPQSLDDEDKCIKRAESRVGGRNYSPVYNNCESFVNRVISGDNTSHEFESANILKKILANIIEALINKLISELLYVFVPIFCQLFNLFSRLWDTFSNFFKRTQQEQKRRRQFCLLRMDKKCRYIYYIKPKSQFSLRETGRKKLLYFDSNIRKVLQRSSCRKRATFMIHNEFSYIEFCVKIESLLKKKTTGKCSISKNDTQKTLCLRDRFICKTMRQKKLAICTCCHFLDNEQKREYSTCFFTMMYQSVCGSKLSGEMQSEVLSLWCEIEGSFFLVKSKITCRNINFTYDQLQNFANKVSICFLGSDFVCVDGLEEGKTTFSDSVYDFGLNSSSFCLKKSHTIQSRNSSSLRFDDSEVLSLKYLFTHESMVNGGTRPDEANRLVNDRQNTENPSFTLLYQLHDLHRQYLAKRIYEHVKQKHLSTMQMRLAYKSEPRRWLATIDIKDVQVQKHVCRYSSCLPLCDHGCMYSSKEGEINFPDSDTDSGFISLSLCCEESHTIQGRDSPSLRFGDSIFPSFECPYGSMAHGGTRLDDDNGLFNDRQNTENHYFTHLDNKCKLRDPDKCSSYKYKLLIRFYKKQTYRLRAKLDSLYGLGGKQSYGMYSPLTFAFEATKFLCETDSNNKDVCMTNAQLQKRACRDSFSYLSGVHECVYGSKLADTFIKYSESASRIDTILDGEYGLSRVCKDSFSSVGGVHRCVNVSKLAETFIKNSESSSKIGTILDDDDNGLFNDIQNAEIHSFPHLDNKRKLQNPDKYSYKYYKPLSGLKEKQSYDEMYSPSTYAYEGAIFFYKTTLNLMDDHMSEVQVQERVCRDSFSSLGGVFGDVYGGATFSMVGTAVGAAAGALVCSIPRLH